MARKTFKTGTLAPELVAVGVRIALEAFLATFASTWRNFNWFDHWEAAYDTIAHEAVVAGTIESRLEVGARCIQMTFRSFLGALIHIATDERTVLVEDRTVDPSLLGLASAMILATWTVVLVRVFVDADGTGKKAWWRVKFPAPIEISAIWRIGPSRLADTLVVDTNGTFVTFCVTTFNLGFAFKVTGDGIVVTEVVPCIGTTEYNSDRMG
jgi:hypothetical protein